MKKVITTIFVVMSTYLFGQGYTYSYVDPCSKEVRSIQVTNNQAITVNYLGNINSFSSNDFLNGTFDNWVNQITIAAADQPCDELLTNTQVSQNMFITQNLISTLTSITATSTMTASNAVANSVSNSSNNSSKGGKKRGSNNSNGSTSNNNTNTSTDGTNNNSQGNTSNGSTTQGGGTQQGGNSSSGSSTSGGNSSQGGTNNQSGGVSQGGGGQTQRGVDNNSNSNSQGQSQGQGAPDGSGKTTESGGGTGGTTNSVSNAAEATSSGSDKKGGKPKVGSIIGTGDIVAIRVNEDNSNQLRGTMSVTKSNTNNTRAKGFLLNYTTTVNNSNLTFYGAFNNKKRTNTFIVANSSMIDFERNFFNTTTALESKTFGKTSLMGGLNFTVGGLGGQLFTNISAVGGGFHPFKLNKNLSGNILILGVYSPFTQFYEGKWWDSGWLIVPFSSWDYAISKNFKYNVSFSGTYEVKGSVLQFQVLTGGKILL
jgi:hypothetical protein